MILFDGRKRVYKGNLHTHSTVSDGRKTPEEIIELYKAAGYDFLAITDHRKFACPLTYNEGFTVLPGAEFDFDLPGEVIHIVGVGITEQCVLEHKKERGAQAAVNAINACGGFAILAHPAWSLNKPSTMLALRGVTASEVYNSVSGLPWNADRADSSLLLDECACYGRLFGFMANDDSHWYNGEHCRAWNMVEAEENTREALLSALRSGHFYSSRGPEIKLFEREGNDFHIVCSPARAIWFSSNCVYNSKRSVTGTGLTEFTYTAVPQQGEIYVRATIEDENGMRAWTNPIGI